MMQLGIFAKTFQRNEIVDVFVAAKAADYEVVHYNLACAGMESMPNHIPQNTIRKISAASLQKRMPICGISATFNMIHPNLITRVDGIRKFHVIASNCKPLGIRFISLCTGTRDPIDKWKAHPDNNSASAWKDLLKTIAALMPIVEEHNLTLGIEPELANVVNSPEKAVTLLKSIGSKHLKIILDPANLFHKATLPEVQSLIQHSVELLGPHIGMAHIKGRNTLGQVVPPAKSFIPFDFFIQQLETISFNGPIVTHGIEEQDAISTAQFLRQYIKKR